ncbi:hypothetical protein BCR33DRAFT_720330 [Rhizoclosmatium globosum]|uniref:Reactive oxygen species modulator 1 n=1 Tax=Rhizoclosmatium globosum TaxID=329046 RepID=A0A1Y2BWD7_9FUNG|nr:hypothetical protein BCR33DRAFT_720330 [Rhizoclosmatium globosum]|eukprot:ORY39072.1 hypothetical protein BCR33DRAFT_720330 [Rhizoclosmatium globosum]
MPMISHETAQYLEKMKMGFLMGGTTGACLGFLVGGEKGYLATTGGFLGFIMSIGMLVRAEGADTIQSPFMKRPIGAFAYNQNRLPIVVEQLKR